jgi:hypothetical protein
MANPNDTWPEPEYHVGPDKHLHAIGVISMVFNGLEQAIARLYRHHLIIQKVPTELIDLHYFGLDESRRIRALKSVFKKYEKNRTVIDIVESIIKYFDWCCESRNKILHSEFHPRFFNTDDGHLHLAKRKSKREAELKYLWFDLSELRNVANKIELGKKQVASLIIHLRQRDTPQEQWPLSLRAHGHEPLPQKLSRPTDLALAPHPFDGPIPHYLRKPLQE